MRNYGVVFVEFWNNPDIQLLSDQAKLLALYLLSNRHGTMLGCYQISLMYVGADLVWSPEKVSQAVSELLTMGFMAYDEKYGWVFIINFLKWNEIQNPNQAKKIITLAEKVPKHSSLWPNVIDTLKYCKYIKPEIVNRLQTVSKPFFNQEQDQELEQDQEQQTHTRAQEKNNHSQPDFLCVTDQKILDTSSIILQPSAKQNCDLPQTSVIQHIFEYWKTVFNHPDAELDDERVTNIRKGLSLNFTVEQLCQAIRGCSQTPYYMGVNERHEVFDGLHVIFKNANQIERFIKHSEQPPSASTSLSGRQVNNISSLKSWLNKKLTLAKTNNTTTVSQEHPHD